MEEVLALQGPLVADIATHVFSFLSLADKQNVAKVCRFWRRIVYLPGLWKDVTAELPLQPRHELMESLKKRGITRITCVRSTEEDLSDLFSSIPNLTHLNIIGCPQVSEDFLVETIPSLSCLQHIAFRKCRRVTNTNRLLKAMRSPKLTKTLTSFALEDCRYASHVGLKALLQTLSNLENLDLSSVRLNSSCLQVLSDSCPKLKRLVLNGCQGVDDDSLKVLADKLDLEYLDMSAMFDLSLQTLTYIVDNFTGLRSLTLGCKQWYIYPDDDSMNDFKTVLKEVSKLRKLEFLAIEVSDSGFNQELHLLVLSTLMKLPNLKRLHLGTISSINDETIIRLADFLPDLQKLSFSSKLVKDDGMTALCSKLVQLKDLSLKRCSLTDKGIEEISTKMQNLETLKLSLNNEFTSAGIRHLVNLNSMTSLNLKMCNQIIDKDVQVIALRMPQLVKLNLSACGKISSQGAIAIGKHLKNLHHLALDNTHIDDKGFIYVSQNLTKLQVLSVEQCFISDHALSEGAKSLGNLKELTIGSIDTTDEGLEDAAQYLTGLVRMTITLAFCVSIEGVEVIVFCLPNLMYLEIDGCRQITPGMVRHLQDMAKITVHNY